MNYPPVSKNITTLLLIALGSQLSACNTLGDSEGVEPRATRSMASSALALEWVEREEGWALDRLSVDGISLSRPQGFSNLVYSEKKPFGSAVECDDAGENHTFYFSEATQVSDRALQFRHSLPLAEIESHWEIDPEFPSDIKVRMNLTARADGYYSIASPTLAALDKETVKWGMVPGNWYGTELENNQRLVGMYSQGIPNLPKLANERNSGTLAPMLTTGNGITLAAIPEPGTSADPWKKDAYSRKAKKVGMSLMNRHHQLTPLLYHPILGQEGSELQAGQTIEFQFRYSIQTGDWFPVFAHVVNNIYQLPSLLELQENSFSLTDRIYRMLHFLEDGERAAWRTWEVYGYEVGATGSKNADAGTMAMLAQAADDAVMQQRMPYIRNFKLAQQQTKEGFFQGAALGEYGDENGFKSEVGNWIEPLFTTYYTMMDMGNLLLFNPDDRELQQRLRLGAEKLLDWQHEDGSWDVGYDVFSHELAFPDLIDLRSTWYGLLIAHRILGDEKYLKAAIKGAEWQLVNGVNRGRYLGVCGDTRNFWDFATAQTSQAYMELYEVTGEVRYREASIEAARVYTTSIFTHPIASDASKEVAGKELKDWQISQVGLGVEHIRGTAGGRGPILLSSYAGLFVRVYEETGDAVFLTMARAAARGRQAFVDPEIGISIYYWDSLPHVQRDTGKFPWHAFWQIGWITDYLISEVHLRSEGAVSFPAGFMTPKVGPHRTFGFSPGKVYGQEAKMIIRQGMIACSNPDIEWITALSENERTLFVLALNQSPKASEGVLHVDLSKLGGDFNWVGESVLQGTAPAVNRSEGKLNLNMPAWGMQVVGLTLE